MLTFPDHHSYSEKDIRKLQEKVEMTGHPDTLILTTEKDAMRLQDLDISDSLKKSLYYVPIRVEFVNEHQKNEFDKIIMSYVRSNQRDNILHKKPDQASA